MEFYPSQELVQNPSSIFHEQYSSLMEIFNVGTSLIPIIKSETPKSLAACKNHSEAERRRRKRINGHLSTLRTLLPNTIKTDKASLLAEVVRRVKELKESTAELTAITNAGCSSNNNKNNNSINEKEHIIPSETDELNLFYSHDQHYGTIKAVICCDDRPDLMSDLTQALSSIQANIMRAEMGTVGGRTKIVLWLVQGSAVTDEDLAAMRQVLVVVMNGDDVVLTESGKDLPGGKRPRVSIYN